MIPGDFVLKLFVDTNILIDATITPEEEVVNFLTKAGQNKYINMITSDYILWEKLDFVRMQNWVSNEIKNNKSYKNAVKHRVVLNDEIVAKICLEVDEYKRRIEEDYKIVNYNLMDSSTKKADFFESLKKLMCASSISKQDLLVLLSAYDLDCDRIVSKDSQFDQDLSRAQQFEINLKEAIIPDSLKTIKFIRDIKKTPQQYYNDWFNEKIIPMSIFKVENEFFNKPNVVAIRPVDETIVKVSDYIYFLKVDNDSTQIHHTKIETGMLRDYHTKNEIMQGNHVTIKLPDSIPVASLRNSYAFIID